jgi:signal peptidase II
VKKNNITLLSVAAVVVGLDQLTKLWIMVSIPLYEQKIVIAGLFNLVHVTNTGAAFGLLAGDHAWWRQAFFVIVALAALTFILLVYRQIRSRGLVFVIAIGLIAGGAIGNLIDRVRFGAVVDFLDFYFGKYHWPAFNVADSAITIGVGLFLVASMVTPETHAAKKMLAK